MTPTQLDKSRRLADDHGFSHVEILEGRIEAVPLEDGLADCVVSNAPPDANRGAASGGESGEGGI